MIPPTNPAPLDLSIGDSIDAISLTGHKIIKIDEKIVFVKLSPTEDFPVKIEAVEFVVNQEKIIKFILTKVEVDIIGFEIFPGS